MKALRTAVPALAGLTVLLATACGGGNSAASFSGKLRSSASSVPSAATSPAPSLDFDSAPGSSIRYLSFGYPVGVRVKVIDTAWVAQLGEVPADPGSHLLSIFVVIKPELDDRGTQGVNLQGMNLKVTVAGGECNGRPVATGGAKSCSYDGWFRSDLRPPELMADSDPDEWTSWSWQSDSYSPGLEPGEQDLAVLAFPVLDSVELAKAQLCGGYLTETSDECLPLAVPADRS